MTTFSNSFFWIVCLFWLQFPWILFHFVRLTSLYWLTPNRCQTKIVNDDNGSYSRIYALRGFNVLNIITYSNHNQTHRMKSWWRRQMETFSALLAICAGNSPVTGEFIAQMPVTRSFDVFCNLRLNKRLSEADHLRRHRARYDVVVMCRFNIMLFSGLLKRCAAEDLTP